MPSTIDLAGAEAVLLSPPGPRVRPAGRPRRRQARLRHHPARLLTEPGRAHPQRPDRRARPDHPDAVRDAQPPRRRPAARHRARRQEDPQQEAARCSASSRPSTTGAACTPARCSRTSASRYDLPVLMPPIPKTVRFAEAPPSGRSILSTARSSKGAAAYREVAAADPRPELGSDIELTGCRPRHPHSSPTPRPPASTRAPSSAATCAPTTSASPSRSPASATPTSTPCARSGAPAHFPLTVGHEIAGTVVAGR